MIIAPGNYSGGITLADLEPRECVTKQYPVHGYHRHAERFGRLHFYGSDAPEIERLMDVDESLAESIHPDLPIIGAEIRWACQREMARTVDDVLARRTRSLLFNARAAIEAAPRVAELMAAELGRDPDWVQAQVEVFTTIARGYVYEP